MSSLTGVPITLTTRLHVVVYVGSVGRGQLGNDSVLAHFVMYPVLRDFQLPGPMMRPLVPLKPTYTSIVVQGSDKTRGSS